MRLESLKFDGENPSEATFTIGIEDLAFLTEVLGRMNGHMADEVTANGYESVTRIYNGAVGMVFNRYWDEGVDGAMRDLGILPARKEEPQEQAQSIQPRIAGEGRL